MRRELVLDSAGSERRERRPQPSTQTAKLKSSAMDLGSVLLTLVAGFILAFLYWLYSFAVAPFRVLSRLGIPGPPPVPFYGNQKMVVKLERLNFFTKMFEKYGNVFGYYLGQRVIIVIKDLDLIKEMMVKQFDNFHDHPPQPGLLRKKASTPRGLLNASGAYWKKIRTTLSPSFSASKMKMMGPLIEVHCETLGSILSEYADTDKSIDVAQAFGNFSLEVILAAAFGRSINIQRGESDDLLTAVKGVFSPAREGSDLSQERIVTLLSNFPWMVSILRLLASRSKSGSHYQTLAKLSMALIRARRETPDAQQKYKDILQLMLDATTDDKEEHKKLTDEEVMAQCVAFILAGYETTSSLLTFTAYLLAKNPEIQDRLVQEIKTYLADHPEATPYEKAHDIGYLDMVVQESMRVLPPVPQTDRYCCSSTTVGDLKVPKGVVVTIPIWHLHHDPDYWPLPEKFDPDRFSEEEKEKRPALAHMPFGLGPRSCIGMRFALMEAKLALITMLSKYKVVPAPETEDPLQLVNGLTSVAKNPLFLRVISH